MNTSQEPKKSSIIESIIPAVLGIAIPVCAWFATEGHDGAGNLVKGWSVLLIIGIPLCVFVTISGAVNQTPKWRQYLSNTSSTITALLLAWNGWLWCGSVIAIYGFCEAVNFQSQNIRELKKSQQPTT